MGATGNLTNSYDSKSNEQEVRLFTPLKCVFSYDTVQLQTDQDLI